MMTDVIEALVRYAQNTLSEESVNMEDKTLAISCSTLFREWVPGKYKVGDIRTKDKVPYECIIAHDSTINTDWTIDERTLWKPYHSRAKEYALPWESPTGAHDMYKTGEYMIWTDGKTYLCKQDTNYSPTEYEQAWELIQE